MLPDVHLAIRTDDEAVVLICYSGRLGFVAGQEPVAFLVPRSSRTILATTGSMTSWPSALITTARGVAVASLLRR